MHKFCLSFLAACILKSSLCARATSSLRVNITDLIWKAVGHDVHLKGDCVHKTLPPGQTIFICRTNRRLIILTDDEQTTKTHSEQRRKRRRSVRITVLSHAVVFSKLHIVCQSLLRFFILLTFQAAVCLSLI